MLWEAVQGELLRLILFTNLGQLVTDFWPCNLVNWYKKWKKKKHYVYFLEITSIAKTILTYKNSIKQNNFNRPTLQHNVESWFATPMACTVLAGETWDPLTFWFSIIPPGRCQTLNKKHLWRIVGGSTSKEKHWWKSQKHDRNEKRYYRELSCEICHIYYFLWQCKIHFDI